MVDVKQQAQNSVDLYAGNPPAMIKRGLSMQSREVIEELKRMFEVETIDDLAIALSMK